MYEPVLQPSLHPLLSGYHGVSHRRRMLAQIFEPPQRYGEVDDSKVFTRVPSSTQRLVIVLACDHEIYHPPIGLGHVFAILLAIPSGGGLLDSLPWTPRAGRAPISK